MAKKLYYKIGEACKLLDIPPYKLRYWETEFPFLAPDKSKSGQRVYSERELQIKITPLSGAVRSMTPEQFKERLAALHQAGVRLIQSEWHHAEFVTGNGGGAPRSSFNIVLHVEDTSANRRVIIKGKLDVDWQVDQGADGYPIPDRIATRDMRLIARVGETAFRPVAQFVPDPRAAANVLADPVLVADLDGNGFSEIILGGRNELIPNRGGDFYSPRPFIEGLPAIFESAVIADFTGDGKSDFVCVGRDGVLRLYSGNGDGTFSSEAQTWDGSVFEMPMVLTAGDIDKDGDLDLWIGQYRPPYKGGHMPTPYYDANDGLPAFLLENDGSGTFRDVTEGSGLETKRFRRTYAASFVDLDEDGNIDLLVTSDFAGTDLYRGDGEGHFADRTSDWIQDRHNFGMSHSFADFDLDGKLDFYVTGMSSTTARRLDHLGLKREDRADIHQMRSAMGYGNRMYLSRGNAYAEPEFRESVARTGWSWGCATLDFDNDGDSDLYVANGHQSGKSARDYCSTFWRHDIYTGSSTPQADVSKLFAVELAPLARREISWNGFEHNALLLNEGGTDFIDVGFLMGVAFEFDSRAVVGEDLNRDGRVDLLVVENSLVNGNYLHQKLHILGNQLDTPGDWIGVRLDERLTGRSPIGAHVRAETTRGPKVATVVTGDSLYSQHSPTVHFGLGAGTGIESLTIRWLDGGEEVISKPEANRYHVVETR